ncbi:hypothetical protein [Nonomuraea candida]|uniref:hypothetical protein n=1 Tax=Nonomuraea candida TaxID=359159 RepID=UPI0012F83567|nr:hypothetical protein [Nonomuraea candida]
MPLPWLQNIGSAWRPEPAGRPDDQMIKHVTALRLRTAEPGLTAGASAIASFNTHLIRFGRRGRLSTADRRELSAALEPVTVQIDLPEILSFVWCAVRTSPTSVAIR